MGFPGQEYWNEYLLLQLSSPPRDGTWVSCIADKFLMDWASREKLFYVSRMTNTILARLMIKKKSHDYLNRGRNRIWQNSTHFPIKNPQEFRYRICLNILNVYMTSPSKHHTEIVKNWRAFVQDCASDEVQQICMWMCVFWRELWVRKITQATMTKTEWEKRKTLIENSQEIAALVYSNWNN